MKNKFRYVTVIIVSMVLVITLAACSTDPSGYYYCDTDSSQYVYVYNVSTSSAYVDVYNVTIEDCLIYNLTETGIYAEIYKTDASNEDLCYFKANTDGKILQGTIDVADGIITIGSATFTRQ